MPSVSLSVKYQIKKVITRFKFEELEDAVLPIFPEIRCAEIKSKLVKNHESLTTANALKILEEKIKSLSLTEKELKNRLSILEVTDVSRHFKRKVWYCHEFRGNGDWNNLALDELSTRIKSNFNIHLKKVDVQIVQHKEIIFLSVKDIPKKRKMKTILPLYFSMMNHQNFIFCSKKIIAKHILAALAHSMGYESCKQIKLTGKDIPSLMKMLLDRKIAAAQGAVVKPSLRFKPRSPTSNCMGLDFTQHKERIKYAEKCFGEEPPTFEFLRVKSSDQNWKSRDDYPKLPDTKIFTVMEFQSTSIPNFLKNLVADRALVMPLPCYASNILTVARNDLTLKET